MESTVERLAAYVLTHRRMVLVGWVLSCVVGAIFAAGLAGRIVPGGEAPADSDSEVVARAITDSPLPSLYLSVVRTPEAADPTLTQALDEVADAVSRFAGVTAVTPLPMDSPVSGDGERVAVLTVSTSGGTDGAIKVAHEIEAHRKELSSPSAAVYVGGFGAYRDQLTALSQSDLERAELFGLPIVFAVLLITFGSVWAAGLPLVIALSALLMGLGAVGCCAIFLPMSDFVTNSASLIGIALGVDYAMFILQRVRELTRRGQSIDAAIISSMRTTGTAVLWSGITVIAAESSLLLVDSRSVRSAGFGMVMVTVFAVLTAIVVMPVVISVLGKKVAGFGRHSLIKQTGRGWQRWARAVTHRAPPWLIGTFALLIALGIPALDLSRSVSIAGVDSLPADASVRLAYEAASARYGPAALSPILLLAPDADPGELASAVEVLLTDPQVAAARAVPLGNSSFGNGSLGNGIEVIQLTSRTSPYDAASRDLVHRLRDGPLGAELGLPAFTVGGETAVSVDATTGMFDGLPLVGTALSIILGLILLLALRSVFLPLKAIVLVVVSLAASIGGLVLLATTSWGATLIGASGPSDIHPLVPVTIVAITVALSTDYEVMLLSRIREHYRDGMGDRASIIAGVGHTGGVITSAAAIMVAVFFGFALADLAPLKQLGVGLGLAVFIDATLVRGVLVPASMAVMGRANWWWPQFRRPAPRRHAHKAAARRPFSLEPPANRSIPDARPLKAPTVNASARPVALVSAGADFDRPITSSSSADG